MPRASTTKTTAAPMHLWLGCFTMLEDDEKRSASFQGIVHATGAADAARQFKARIRSLRKTSGLFGSRCSVFLDALFELTPKQFPVPTIVNYASKKEETAWDIWCPVPEQPDARAEGWGPENEEDLRDPLVDFATKKNQTPRRAPSAAQRARMVAPALERLKALRLPTSH